MKKLRNITALLITIVIKINAQELPQLNSFMFNQFLYNPAAGGMYNSDFNFNASSRIQWSGVDGAPLTNNAWADYRFSKNKMALGANLIYDRFGARTFTDVAFNYSYILRLTNKLKFSMGLRAGFTSASFNAQSISKIWDSDDPNLQGQVVTNYPKFGTGFQLYGRKFYLSLSLPDLVALQNEFATDKSKSFFQKNRNYVLMAGYKIKLSDAFGLYPNIKASYFPTSQARVDIATLFEITDYFWTGPNISSSGTAALMAGTFISSRVRFMYAYEFLLSPVSNSSSTILNVHEICLMIQMDELFKSKK